MPFSLSGVDGTGKSQQIRLLSQGSGDTFHITKPLIEYSQRWPKLKGPDMSRWWFEEVSVEELTDIIIESLNNRNKDQQDGKIAVLDRGWRMFQTVCAATWSIREGVPIEDAVFMVGQKFRQGLDHSAEEFEVLLVPNEGYLHATERCRKLFRSDENHYEEYMNQRYARYQLSLRRAVGLCFAEAPIQRIQVTAPIADVQNALRSAVNQAYQTRVTPIGNSISRVVGFGGLSECGKSSFADYLRRRGYYRLKLRYFIEIIEERGERATPEKVACELFRFCQKHYYVTEYTVESLHDPYIPAFLKLMLGSRMQIVYLDTDEDTRVRRAKAEMGADESKARTEVRGKDQVKLSRGALQVRDIADVVFDNSPDSLVKNLEHFSQIANL